jgi:hypothetical protein
MGGKTASRSIFNSRMVSKFARTFLSACLQGKLRPARSGGASELMIGGKLGSRPQAIAIRAKPPKNPCGLSFEEGQAQTYRRSGYEAPTAYRKGLAWLTFRVHVFGWQSVDAYFVSLGAPGTCGQNCFCIKVCQTQADSRIDLFPICAGRPDKSAKIEADWNLAREA